MMRSTANVAVAAICLVTFAGSAHAGSGNTITIIQDRTFGTEGNTLTVDQSLAQGSEVRGLEPGLPALQTGSDNSAVLSIEGNGGLIELLQDNSGSQGAGNVGTVTVVDGGAASLAQIGSGNVSALDVSGTLAQGSVLQAGDGNNANLTVEGTNASGAIVQSGNSNYTGLEVTGAGTNVTYNVIGSNLSNVAAGGVTVYTNGATVTITQTSN